MKALQRFSILFLSLIIVSASVTITIAVQQEDKPPPAPEKQVEVDPSTGWPRPRSDQRVDERSAMVKHQIQARDVRDPKVIEAMRSVPRHWFIPDRMQRGAYFDRPLLIGHDQTISQPYIVAFMTESLKLNKDSKVLEIGTGSGYQAAVLSEITPHVFTIEIVEPLGRLAIETFQKHGYSTIQTKIGDGYQGWPEHAPFDAIIVTCAPDHIPPKLIEQLKPTGCMCIPVGSQGAIQKLVLVTKTKEGKLQQKNLMPVKFVPMTGDAQTKPNNE